jgi:hypothetical protein
VREESFNLVNYVLLYHPEGNLVRLSKKWENKQFDGTRARFSRLKILYGERSKQYRLRIVWYERVDNSNFSVLSSLTSLTSFKIIAHAPTRRASAPQQPLFIEVTERDLSSSKKRNSQGETHTHPSSFQAIPHSPTATTPTPSAIAISAPPQQFFHRPPSITAADMSRNAVCYSPNLNTPIDLSILHLILQHQQQQKQQQKPQL